MKEQSGHFPLHSVCLHTAFYVSLRRRGIGKKSDVPPPRRKGTTFRAKLRLMVRRILRKYKYPPDHEARAVDLVLQQAEVLSEAWVS